MPRPSLRALGLAALAWLAPPAVQAQITIDRSVIEFSPDEPMQDIELRNDGDFKIYLDLKIAEILDPHTASPTRVELEDPRAAPMLVSPRQVLVLPGQRKRVRVIMREAATDVDRVFRLAIKPYTGKVELGAALPGETSTGIKVLLGYDVLLLSRPAELAPKLRVERTDATLTLENLGNTNVLLRRITQCEADGGDCEELQPNRLYAGERLELALPKVGPKARYPVEVVQAIGLRSSRASY